MGNVSFHFLQIRNTLSDFPVIETVTFLILVLITIYRKRLSSNHEYRDRTNEFEAQSPFPSSKESLKRRKYAVNNNSNNLDGGESFTAIIHDFKAEVLSSMITDPSDIFLEDGNAPSISNPSSVEHNNQSQELHSFATVSSLKSPSSSSSPGSSSSSSSSSQSLSFLRLSNELIFHILSHCDTIDIIRLSLISKGFHHEVLHNEFLWEQLWMITYAHIWQDAAVKEIRSWREIFWDPSLLFPAPQYGWFKFYVAFELCWIDWLLAGLCTREKCYIAINDAIFHVTDFIPEHPGSAETLLDHSGGDVTDLFVDIGHSEHALSLLENLCIFDIHRIYLNDNHYRQREMRNRYYNHMKIRQVSLIPPLKEAMHQLQKKIVSSANQRNNNSALSTSGNPYSSTLLTDEVYSIAPRLTGYLICVAQTHVGHCRAFFDPLSREWVLWYTCCGKGQILQHLPSEILADSKLRNIFEDN